MKRMYEKFGQCFSLHIRMGNHCSKRARLKMGSLQVSSDEDARNGFHFHDRKKNLGDNCLDDRSIMKHYGYDLYETIGKGAYAKVKRGYSRKLNKDVAIKIVDRKKAPFDVRSKFLPREVRITYFAKHENIVQCFEIFKAQDRVYMILEKIENGDLLRYVVDQSFVVESRAKRIAKGITSALRYLHENQIVHRDLKLENILIDRDFNAKLTDFGFARRIEGLKLSCTYCGSAAYAPIEILTGIPYDPFKVDIWSLGVVIYTMTIGYMPFTDSKQIVKMRRGVKFDLVKQHPSRRLQSLLKMILVNDPMQRPSFGEILKHTWLVSLERNLDEQKYIGL